MLDHDAAGWLISMRAPFSAPGMTQCVAQCSCGVVIPVHEHAELLRPARFLIAKYHDPALARLITLLVVNDMSRKDIATGLRSFGLLAFSQHSLRSALAEAAVDVWSDCTVRISS